MRRSWVRPLILVWRRARLGAALAAGGVALASCGEHAVSQNPTWADVEPILRGTCTQCHGAAANLAGMTYRFDFYDMTPDVCGDAAIALNGQLLAVGLASQIGQDVTPPGSGWRPKMPPAPTHPLADWERETLQRWATTPVRGTPRGTNRQPVIQLDATSGVVDKSLPFSAVVSDPDGESVVGVLKIGDETLVMDRPGLFSTTLDTSKWAEGTQAVSATLCDGWNSITYQLGNVQISHAPPAILMGGGGAGGGGSAGAAGNGGAGGMSSAGGGAGHASNSSAGAGGHV
jgi:uncharacterized membrane protein YgcG